MNEKEILRITTVLGDDKDMYDAYYVYMLCENEGGVNKPFYIGKGKGTRILQHEIGAEQEISERKKELLSDFSYSNALSDDEIIAKANKDIGKKYQKINELGIDNVVKVIVKWGLTESEALMAESSLINAYAFTNGQDSLTNIINGHMSNREKGNISCTTKARTLQEFLDECGASEKCITEIDEPVLFLKIKALYPLCMQLSKDRQEKAIYDSCRACWILSEAKINKIKYVFALYNSQVVGIYAVNKNSWKKRIDMDGSFPIFPPEKRNLEIMYGNIAKDCSTLSEMKELCQNFDEFLSVSKIEEDDEHGFNVWKNRYYFVKSDDEIPDNIKSFKNCILVKPSGDKFFSGRGNQSEKMYNFDVNKNDVIIKTEEDYKN